jgi:hypothetical protein
VIANTPLVPSKPRAVQAWCWVSKHEGIDHHPFYGPEGVASFEPYSAYLDEAFGTSPDRLYEFT